MEDPTLSQTEKPARPRPPDPTGHAKPTTRTVIPSRDAGAAAFDESGYSLNIVGVYQDALTRDWALQACRLPVQLFGEEHVETAWYHLDVLDDSAILGEAISAALLADVIVVSVYAADELPLELYAWIDIWLPRRLSRPGALAALVGAAHPLDVQSVRTREYLHAVARRGRMDFIPQGRQRPVAPQVSAIDLKLPPARATAPVLPELRGRRHEAQSHWGLNE